MSAPVANGPDHHLKLRIGALLMTIAQKDAELEEARELLAALAVPPPAPPQPPPAPPAADNPGAEVPNP